MVRNPQADAGETLAIPLRACVQSPLAVIAAVSSSPVLADPRPPAGCRPPVMFALTPSDSPRPPARPPASSAPHFPHQHRMQHCASWERTPMPTPRYACCARGFAACSYGEQCCNVGREWDWMPHGGVRGNELRTMSAMSTSAPAYMWDSRVGYGSFAYPRIMDGEPGRAPWGWDAKEAAHRDWFLDPGNGAAWLGDRVLPGPSPALWRPPTLPPYHGFRREPVPEGRAPVEPPTKPSLPVQNKPAVPRAPSPPPPPPPLPPASKPVTASSTTLEATACAPRPRKRRKPACYKCGWCGLPKKGHVCALKP